MQIALPVLLGISLLAVACQKNESQLQENARPDDVAGTSIGRLVDGDRIAAYLKTGSSYYRLECPSLLGLEQLIKGFGYPMDTVKDNPSLTMDQFLTMPGAQPDFALSCDLGTLSNTRLVRLVESDKYFISIDSGSGSRFMLRMMGCSSAIGSLGFDMSKALPVSSENYDIFDGSDSLDINCYAGEKPQSDKLTQAYQLEADKARLLRIQSGIPGSPELALHNGTKAFRLECEGDADGSRRLAAFGFDKNLSFLTPLVGMDSDAVVSSGLSSQAVLKCGDPSASLKSIDWPAGKKYYLFFKEVKDKAVLHEVGCRELLDYVNPQLFSQASPIAPETAEAFYTYAAEDKLECLRGTAL
jgi:hypothetical protein